MTLTGRKMAGIAVGIGLFVTQAMAADALAVGQRVTGQFAGGKEGTIMKIGGVGDPYTYRGCYFVHFDYEGDDTTLGQWTCPPNGFKLTPLADQPAAAAPAPATAGPPGAPAQPQPLPDQQPQPLPQ